MGNSVKARRMPYLNVSLAVLSVIRTSLVLSSGVLYIKIVIGLQHGHTDSTLVFDSHIEFG